MKLTKIVSGAVIAAALALGTAAPAWAQGGGANGIEVGQTGPVGAIPPSLAQAEAASRAACPSGVVYDPTLACVIGVTTPGGSVVALPGVVSIPAPSPSPSPAPAPAPAPPAWLLMLDGAILLALVLAVIVASIAFAPALRARAKRRES